MIKRINKVINDITEVISINRHKDPYIHLHLIRSWSSQLQVDREELVMYALRETMAYTLIPSDVAPCCSAWSSTARGGANINPVIYSTLQNTGLN